MSGGTRRELPLLAVPLATLGAYLATRSPAVGLIDAGELAAGCHLLNILHPTGYPLYTMLGRLASALPFGSVAGRLVVLSALFAAAGVGGFILLVRRLGVSRRAAAVAGLLLGFSFPVWAVAVDVEVYSLTFLLLGFLWLGAVAVEAGRPLLLFGYLAGLALTNHMTAASAVAGAAVVALAGRGRARQLGPAALAFAAALSLYLFLPVRTGAGPLLAWGNPDSLERLWWHITGKQYRVWMFSAPLHEVAGNAARGGLLLGQAFAWAGLAPVGLGVAALWRRRRRLAIGLLASALLGFGYAVNYSIPDIESYFIPSLFALAVFGAVGLDRVWHRFRRAGWAAVLLPLAALAVNWGSAGKTGDTVAYDQARLTLDNARPNATIVTDWWDLYAPAFYLQHVDGLRPDICLIDKELLRRSWYFDYLARAYPWLVESSGPEIAAFRAYLDEFEHGRLRESDGIQRAYIAMIESFVRRHPDRPAYLTFGADTDDGRELFPGLARAPVGLLFELRADTVLPEFDYSAWRVRLPGRRLDDRTRACLGRYRFFLARRAQALYERGRAAEAAELAQLYRSLPVSRVAPLPGDRP